MLTQRFKTVEMEARSKSLLIWEILGFIFVSAFAVLFHFLYELSSRQAWVGIFTATNESVFEHTKILFYPYIIYSIVEYFFIGRDIPGFFRIKSLCALLLPVGVITFFYTYSGVWGRQSMVVDISSTFVYSLLAFILSYKSMTRGVTASSLWWTVPLLFIVIGLFTWWSLKPPEIQLFYDALNHTFGMIRG